MTGFSDRPLMLVPNKITRSYPGGREIDRFRGKEPIDDDGYGEAWVGSCSRVNNIDELDDKNTGMAQLNLPDGHAVYVQEFIDSDPAGVLGEKHVASFGNNPNILVKLLDPAELLALQVHPTRKRAKEAYGLDFGKAECWYILSLRDDTPEKPYILLGFKEGITRESFEELYEKEDIAAMENCCHKVYIQPDEMYFVDGGIIHTVGRCFLIEIQEPTDLISMVSKNPDWPQGPDSWKEHELGTFIYDGKSFGETVGKYRVPRQEMRRDENGIEQILIGSGQTPFFSGLRYSVSGGFKPVQTGTFSIAIVTDGSGVIRCKSGDYAVKKGDEVFLPAGIEDMMFVSDTGEEPLTIVRCLPPGAV